MYMINYQFLFLGNLDSKRDWGHAKDYVEAMWLMLQQDHPKDYVIASGTQHSVRDFIEAAATELDMGIEWQGSGVDEKGIDPDGRIIVAVDPRYHRPTEVESLLGDPTEVQRALGWRVRTTFQELVTEMATADLALARSEMNEAHPPND